MPVTVRAAGNRVWSAGSGVLSWLIGSPSRCGRACPCFIAATPRRRQSSPNRREQLFGLFGLPANDPGVAQPVWPRAGSAVGRARGLAWEWPSWLGALREAPHGFEFLPPLCCLLRLVPGVVELHQPLQRLGQEALSQARGDFVFVPPQPFVAVSQQRF